MADRRIVVDPVTRIEGHLRVQAVIGDNNVIRDSQSTGTMWRGLEVILKGRDPRDAWAFVERICGVCTGIHALAAVRSVEDAIGIKIPKNANIIRNLTLSSIRADASCSQKVTSSSSATLCALRGRPLWARIRMLYKLHFMR